MAQTAQVRLLVNNTPAPAAADLSDLLLLDNITGLAVRESPGNRTSAGFQAFGRKFLAGEGGARRVGDTRTPRACALFRVFTQLVLTGAPRGASAEGTTSRQLHPIS